MSATGEDEGKEDEERVNPLSVSRQQGTLLQGEGLASEAIGENER